MFFGGYTILDFSIGVVAQGCISAIFMKRRNIKGGLKTRWDFQHVLHVRATFHCTHISQLTSTDTEDQPTFLSTETRLLASAERKPLLHHASPGKRETDTERDAKRKRGACGVLRVPEAHILQR